MKLTIKNPTRLSVIVVGSVLGFAIGGVVMGGAFLVGSLVGSFGIDRD
jgi:hypothetical protein